MPNYVTLEVYLVDEDGNYIVTEQGDRIIVDTFTVPDQLGITQNATAADSLLFEQGRAVPKRLRHAPKSWDVLPIADEYVVRFNQQEIAGRWKNVWSALGQVAGTYTRYDGTGIPSLIQSPSSTNPAISLIVTPPTANLGDTVNFATTFFNFPTDISQAVDTLTLTYTDPLGGTGLVSSDKDQIIDNLVPAFALNIPGTWTFRVDVISTGINFVGFSTDTVSISVPNTPPVINSFTVAPSVTGNDIEGQPSTIAFSATDAESSFLTYTLTGDQGTSFTGSVGNGIPEVLTGVMPAGTETYTLTVTDVNGLTDTETTTVTGEANTAPVINFINRNRIPGGGSVINSGDTVQVTTSFTDLNGTRVNYVIRQDGVVKASGTSAQGAKNFSEDITNVTSTSGFEVTLTDTVDPSLTATSTSGGLTLNTAPSVAATLTDNTSSLTLNGTVTDDLSPNSDLTYTWEEFKDGVSNGAVANFNGAVTIDDFGAPLALRNTTGMAPGTYTYALTVTDGLGLSTTDVAPNSYVVAAANQPPVIPDTDSARYMMYNGTQLTLIYDCTGADPDGDGSGTMTYDWEYSLDGGTTFAPFVHDLPDPANREMVDSNGGGAANTSWTANPGNPLYNGTYTFRFTLTDDDGATDTVTYSSGSFAGSLPSITITDQTDPPSTSSFAPSDLANAITWFSADALDGTLSNGEAVTSWTSEIDGTSAATQGSSDRQPEFVVASTETSQPAVFFDGGADGGNWDTLTWTQSALNVGTDDLVCIVVGNADTRSGTPFSTLGRGANSAASLQGLYNGANTLFTTSAGTDSESGIDITSKTGGTQYRSIVYGRYDGKLTARWSGDELSARGTSTVALTSTDYALISAYFSGGAEGEVSDVIFLKNPTLSDIEKVEGWAAHKYGYTSELPAAHPYKSAAPVAEWSPANVATSEQGFWVNADAIHQGDGTTINNLLDEYGNVTFTNGSGTARPKLSTDVLNGRNSIEFTNGGDGDDFLAGTWADQATIGSGDVWAYTVADHTGNYDNNPAIFCLNYGSNPTRRWMLQRSETNDLMRLFQVGGQFNSTVVTSDNVPYIIGTKRTSGLNNMYIDGTLQSANSSIANDFNTTEVKLGSENNTFGCWDGNIYEVVVGKGTLTDDLREKLEGYFAHKYGLTAQLPANHPYKSTPPTV